MFPGEEGIEARGIKASGSAPPSLRADGVSVAFGPVRALDAATLEIFPGEIHALCGENGAGKSTLIRCLGGAMRPASGRITLAGAPLSEGVRATEAAGVSVIHQEPLSFPDLSAEDNIFAGRETARAAGLWLNRAEMRRRARELLGSLGESIDTRRPVGELPLAQRQMVAIARALAFECRFLILDEPTASLSAREAGTLHTLVRSLAARGVGLLFVSHRLDEVAALADRVTILRDGRHVCTRSAAELPRDELVRLMVGRGVAAGTARRGAVRGAPRLAVRGLTRTGAFRDISFVVAAGEIVGLAGLVGAGRSEVARAIAGVDRPDAGSIEVDGAPLEAGSVRRAVAVGLAMAPEDRRGQGLILPMSVASNVGLADPPGLRRRGMISRARERSLALAGIERLAIKARGPHASVATLSGGNQQKVLLARWLAHRPKVLILDEPTRGVDVGAKAQIHSLIHQLADDGAAVVVISSDLPEVLDLCGRVLVMCEGSLRGELAGAAATPDAVLALAMLPERGAA